MVAIPVPNISQLAAVQLYQGVDLILSKSPFAYSMVAAVAAVDKGYSAVIKLGKVRVVIVDVEDILHPFSVQGRGKVICCMASPFFHADRIIPLVHAAEALYVTAETQR